MTGIKVLLLTPEQPDDMAGLRGYHEVRAALDAIRMGRSAIGLEIAAELAVRQPDLHAALLRHNPRIVHIAAHGRRDGIIPGRREVLDGDTLVDQLTAFGSVRMVVLNGREILHLSQKLSGAVDYVVAMEATLADTAAVEFAGTFYAALAFGHSVPFAFVSARASVTGRFPAGVALPELWIRDGAEEWPEDAMRAHDPAGATDASASIFTDLETTSVARMINETGTPPSSGNARRMA